MLWSDARLRSTRLILVALAFMLVFSAGSSIASAQDVVATAPADGATVSDSDLIRFSWLPDSGQDQFKIIFSQTNWATWTMWDASLNKTGWVYGTSNLVSATMQGLTAGTRYWRICAAWSSEGLFPTCYLTSAGGALNVISSSAAGQQYEYVMPALSLARARGNAQWVARHRFKGRFVGSSCVRHSVSQVLCYVRMNRGGRGYARYVYLSTDDSGGVLYSLVGF